MAEDMKQGGMPKPGGIVPSRDIRPLAEKIDAMMAEAAGAPPVGGAGSMAGESGAMPGTGGTAAPSEDAAMAGVAVIADVLGVSMEKAQALMDAAQQMPKLAGLSPEQLAAELSTDMNLRMQLEKNMGAGEDMKMRKSMSEAPMSAPPPMEPTPAGGMK